MKARKILKAQLLPGVRKANDGVNCAFVGSVFNELKQTKSAYLKLYRPDILTIELFASKLAEELELPTPESMLVTCQGKDIINLPFRFNLSPEQQYVAFATTKLQSPSLKQLASPNQVYDSRLAKFIFNNFVERCKNVPHITAFDEFIANRDRNIGNFLWDGDEIFYLIDHDQSLNVKLFDSNKLLGLLLSQYASNPRTINKIFKSGDDWLAKLSEECIQNAHRRIEELGIDLLNSVSGSIATMLRQQLPIVRSSFTCRRSETYQMRLTF